MIQICNEPGFVDEALKFVFVDQNFGSWNFQCNRLVRLKARREVDDSEGTRSYDSLNLVLPKLLRCRGSNRKALTVIPQSVKATRQFRIIRFVFLCCH